MKKIISTYPEVARLILSRESQFKKDRATTKVQSEGDKTRVIIEAKDKSALQAATSSVQKIILIFEKVRKQWS